MKVLDLANDLGYKPKEFIKLLAEVDVKVKSRNTKLDDETVGVIRDLFSEDKSSSTTDSEEAEPIVNITLSKTQLSVSALIQLLNVSIGDVLKCILQKGLSYNLNSIIDAPTAKDIAYSLNINLILDDDSDKSADSDDLKERMDKLDSSVIKESVSLVKRSPVITIMGHVDHGKTQILDTIRKSHIIDSESGGITQHIGAYQVNFKDRDLTFLDTPGHEAFTSLRARGSQITDIAILVVAGDESVKPQTLEALDHAKAANVPIIVALNKMDKDTFDAEKCKQDLSQHDLLAEDWGGEVVMVSVSGKTGEGIPDLLDMICLVSDMLELQTDTACDAKAVIIESQLSPQKGPVATGLVKAGTLRVGDLFIVGSVSGRIRALTNDQGQSVKSAAPGCPVEIMGIPEVPIPGEVLEVFPTEKAVKRALSHRLDSRSASNKTVHSVSLETLSQQIEKGNLKQLNLIIKADAHGSLEAIVSSIEKIPTDEDEQDTIHDNEQYLKSIDEMNIAFAQLPDALENTKKIADKCSVEFDLDTMWIPYFDCPDGLNPENYLEKLVWKGIEKKYKNITDEVKERVKFELDIIIRMQYPSYFLIIYDFLEYCRQVSIPVGPGRGSAAGSIVAYALDITLIDPLKYKLLFERFLNPDRVSMPDIDLDFCIKRRGEVIEYIVQTYGEDKVAQIITFGTMQARAVIRDVGRVLDIPLNEVDRIAKLIPATPGKYASIEETLETIPDFKKVYDEKASYKKLIDFGRRLEGLSRHSSTHAAGVVISKNKLAQVVPLVKNDGQVATQFSMTTLETIGLLKMDILGLRNLTVIDEVCQQIKNNRQEIIDLEALELDDPKTYELLCSGQTIGVFQLESTGMRELIKNLKPSTFEDIIALLALYRPGPLGSGMVNDFISNKSGETQIKYELPELEPLLKDTYGMILYQEQVMQIASVIGGFTLAEADMLRRAMGKKKKSVMDNLKAKFIEGAKAQKINTTKANKIFELCYKFAEYGFNKSHSAAYALISYQTAYLKANYPKEYMTGLLSSIIGNTDKTTLYIQDCKDLGLKVYTPHVNHSEFKFSMESDGVRFGLGAIKNVGEGAVESLVENRPTEGYKTLMELCLNIDLRQANKRVLESLIKCGVCDEFDSNRERLLASLEPTLDRAQSILKERSTGQTGLFGQAVEETAFGQLDTEDYERLTDVQRLKHEKELTGVYLTGHPLDQLTEKLEKQQYNTDMITDKLKDTSVELIGLLTDCRRILTKTKREIVVGTLEDHKGTVSVVLFASPDFEKIADIFQDENIVVVRGKIRASQDRVSLNCDSMSLIHDVLRTKQIHIDIEEHQELSDLNEIRKLCQKHPGNIPVYIHVSDRVILTHKKYWVTSDAKDKLMETLGEVRLWEA